MDQVWTQITPKFHKIAQLLIYLCNKREKVMEVELNQCKY